MGKFDGIKDVNDINTLNENDIIEHLGERFESDANKNNFRFQRQIAAKNAMLSHAAKFLKSDNKEDALKNVANMCADLYKLSRVSHRPDLSDEQLFSDIDEITNDIYERLLDKYADNWNSSLKMDVWNSMGRSLVDVNILQKDLGMSLSMPDDIEEKELTDEEIEWYSKTREEFGKSTENMYPLIFDEGSEARNHLQNKAHEFGLVLSDIVKSNDKENAILSLAKAGIKYRDFMRTMNGVDEEDSLNEERVTFGDVNDEKLLSDLFKEKFKEASLNDVKSYAANYIKIGDEIKNLLEENGARYNLSKDEFDSLKAEQLNNEINGEDPENDEASENDAPEESEEIKFEWQKDIDQAVQNLVNKAYDLTENEPDELKADYIDKLYSGRSECLTREDEDGFYNGLAKAIYAKQQLVSLKAGNSLAKSMLNESGYEQLIPYLKSEYEKPTPELRNRLVSDENFEAFFKEYSVAREETANASFEVNEKDTILSELRKKTRMYSKEDPKGLQVKKYAALASVVNAPDKETAVESLATAYACEMAIGRGKKQIDPKTVEALKASISESLPEEDFSLARLKRYMSTSHRDRLFNNIRTAYKTYREKNPAVEVANKVVPKKTVPKKETAPVVNEAPKQEKPQTVNEMPKKEEAPVVNDAPVKEEPKPKEPTQEELATRKAELQSIYSRMAKEPEFCKSKMAELSNTISSFAEKGEDHQPQYEDAYVMYFVGKQLEQERQRAQTILPKNASNLDKLKNQPNPIIDKLIHGNATDNAYANAIDDAIKDVRGTEAFKAVCDAGPNAMKELISDKSKSEIFFSTLRGPKLNLMKHVNKSALEALTQPDGFFSKNTESYNKMSDAIKNIYSKDATAGGAGVEDYKKLYEACRDYSQTHDSMPSTNNGKLRAYSAMSTMYSVGVDLAVKDPSSVPKFNTDNAISMARNKDFRDAARNVAEKQIEKTLQKYSAEYRNGFDALPEDAKRLITTHIQTIGIADGLDKALEKTSGKQIAGKFISEAEKSKVNKCIDDALINSDEMFKSFIQNPAAVLKKYESKQPVREAEQKQINNIITE